MLLGRAVCYWERAPVPSGTGFFGDLRSVVLLEVDFTESKHPREPSRGKKAGGASIVVVLHKKTTSAWVLGSIFGSGFWFLQGMRTECSQVWAGQDLPVQSLVSLVSLPSRRRMAGSHTMDQVLFMKVQVHVR